MLDIVLGLFCFVNLVASVFGIYGAHVANMQVSVKGHEDDPMFDGLVRVVNNISSYTMMLIAFTSTTFWGFLMYLLVTGARLQSSNLRTRFPQLSTQGPSVRWRFKYETLV